MITYTTSVTQYTQTAQTLGSAQHSGNLRYGERDVARNGRPSLWPQGSLCPSPHLVKPRVAS